MAGGKFNKIAEKKECKTNYGLKFILIDNLIDFGFFFYKKINVCKVLHV